MLTGKESLSVRCASRAIPLFLIWGPCLLKANYTRGSWRGKIAKVASIAEFPYIFKSSYDKAQLAPR